MPDFINDLSKNFSAFGGLICCCLFVSRIAFASYERDFPSLAIGANGEVDQVVSALQGVHSSGKLVVLLSSETNSKFYLNEISKLPTEVKDRILIVDSKDKDEYMWIRDTGTQWKKQISGKWAFRQDIGSNGSGELQEALRLCTDGEIEASTWIESGKSEEEDELKGDQLGQGGNILSDGVGNCAVGESAGWNKYKIKLYKKEFNCKNLVIVPKNGWPMRHPNKHADLMISFVGPGIALVPKVSDSCTHEYSIGYRQVANETALRAKRQQIEVHRVELSGCPVDYFDSPINLTETKEAFILPQSENTQNFENSKKVISELMKNKKIPLKNITPFKVSVDLELINGGSARCITLPIPATLQNCTQSKLDQAIAKIRNKAKHILQCMDAKPNMAMCNLGTNFSNILEYVANRTTTIITSKEEIKISAQDQELLKKQKELLDKKLSSFCK